MLHQIEMASTLFFSFFLSFYLAAFADALAAWMIIV